MTTTQHLLTMVQGEPIAQQGGRLLTGFLGKDEAVRFLLGGRPPGADEDLSAISSRVEAAQDAAVSRPAFVPQSPIVPTDNRNELDAVAGRPEVQASFAGMSWRIEMVDLRYVQAVQKVIKTDGLETRIEPVIDGKTSLLDFCLPTTQPEPPHGTFSDADGKGFTISSLNPNLRIAGGQASRADVATSAGAPTVPMMALTILVFLGTSYLQVASYRDRYFLRDGYHRAAALLRADIHIVPCVFIEAASFEQVTPGAGFFSYEVSYSERPPIIPDFWDAAVADDVLQTAVRKVVRVRGDEFAVQG